MKRLSSLRHVFCLLCLVSGMLSLSPVRAAQAEPESVPPAGLSSYDWAQIEDLLAEALLSQQAYLKASNTEANDFFGRSVAVSGDTVVIGTDYEDSNATGVNGDQNNNSAESAGAVYVFVRSGETWSQQAYLKASNTEAKDYFASSVAIDGDTVVVGAPNEDSNATGVDGDQNNNSAPSSGAAYVFTRSGATWSQQAYLKASNTEWGDNFGWSVAVSGDTVVVGAYTESSGATGVNGDQNDNSAFQSGAAYVFVRGGATWSQEAYLKASNTAASDVFGSAVAVSGDTAVVAARNEDSNATGVDGDQSNNSAASSGAAYVFVRGGGGTWSQQAYLKASNTEAGDYFGWSVSVSGDTVVAGAYLEDSNATGVNGDQGNNFAANSGAAYVFARSGATWSQQAYLKASNTDGGDSFGQSVAISGDTVVVGAIGEENTAGAAYVFTRSNGNWSQQAYLKASNTEMGDHFGWSIAVSGNTVAVGAMKEDSNATGVDGNQGDNSANDSGATYVFYTSPNNAPTDLSLSPSSVAENQPADTKVGTLTTTDPDVMDTHTYSLACAVPGADDASFQIGGAGNYELHTAAVFDYETKNSYNICVRTDDGNGGTYDENFVITITDVVETLTATFRSVSDNDGWILETSETSNKGGTMNSTVTTFRLGDDKLKKQYRSILSFATGSPLPDNAVITKVTLKVKKQGITGGGNPVTTFQGFMADIKKGLFGTSALQTGDFQATASKTYGPFNTALSGGWYTINLTAGKAYINKLATGGGLTQIRLRFKLDDNNNTVANYLSLYSGNAGASSRPQLIIEYYVP